jgi:hypothetical protein
MTTTELLQSTLCGGGRGHCPIDIAAVLQKEACQ